MHEKRLHKNVFVEFFKIRIYCTIPLWCNKSTKFKKNLPKETGETHP